MLPFRWADVVAYAKYGTPEPPHPVHLTEAEWATRLDPATFAVLRQRGTEPPYRNAYCRAYEPGRYHCVGCGSLLFEAATKYHAISGWPSFTQPARRGAVRYLADFDHRMTRVEVRCACCDGHLGHVFPDGPEPAGLRYCINSVCLRHELPAAEA